MARFDDRVVLITGAGSGIGKASAQRIASEGGTVVCVDLQEEAVQQVADEIVASGGEACALSCDVSDQQSVKATVAAAVQRYGKLHALCNIAGVLRFDNFHDLTLEELRQFSGQIAADVFAFLDVRNSVERRKSEGGTAADTVRGAIGEARKRLEMESGYSGKSA